MAQGALIYSEFFTNAQENNQTVFVKTGVASVMGKVEEVFADGVTVKQEANERIYALKFQDICHVETK